MLIATSECGGSAGALASVPDRCVESRDIRHITEVHVREIVPSQMLAFVILEPLGIAKPGSPRLTIRTVVLAAREMHRV